MIGQQVHFVDVQHTAVRRGEQSRLVSRDAFIERALQVKRAHQPVLSGTNRQFHQLGATDIRYGCAGVRPVRA
jgi:hypothetical protein